MGLRFLYGLRSWHILLCVFFSNTGNSPAGYSWPNVRERNPCPLNEKKRLFSFGWFIQWKCWKNNKTRRISHLPGVSTTNYIWLLFSKKFSAAFSHASSTNVLLDIFLSFAKLFLNELQFQIDNISFLIFVLKNDDMTVRFRYHCWFYPSHLIFLSFKTNKWCAGNFWNIGFQHCNIII